MAHVHSLTAIQPVVLAAEWPTVAPSTYAAIPVQTRASPVILAALRPNGDGNHPGGDRDAIVACSRPEPLLAHEKGFAQPATASSDDQGVFRDVIVACLRPGSIDAREMPV
ncbi:hypothetical protein HGA34_01010 [Candidatus Falkowbacteria bacterium]|nr:hypothetical protein [Candidatus Falkowbacteria bacterium]